MAKKWTQAEIQQLLTNEGLISIEKLAKDLGRTESAVISKFLKEKEIAEPTILFKINGILTDKATVKLTDETTTISAFLIGFDEPSALIAWSVLMGKNIVDIIMTYPDLTNNYSIATIKLNGTGLAKINARMNTTTKTVNLTIE